MISGTVTFKVRYTATNVQAVGWFVDQVNQLILELTTGDSDVRPNFDGEPFITVEQETEI